MSGIKQAKNFLQILNDVRVLTESNSPLKKKNLKNLVVKIKTGQEKKKEKKSTSLAT